MTDYIIQYELYKLFKRTIRTYLTLIIMHVLMLPIEEKMINDFIVFELS